MRIDGAILNQRCCSGLLAFSHGIVVNNNHESLPPSIFTIATGHLWLRWVLASALGAAPGLALALVLAAIGLRYQLDIPDPLARLRTLAAFLTCMVPALVLGLGVSIGLIHTSPVMLRREWSWLSMGGYGMAWCLTWSVSSYIDAHYVNALGVHGLMGVALFAALVYVVPLQLVLLDILNFNQLMAVFSMFDPFSLSHSDPNHDRVSGFPVVFLLIFACVPVVSLWLAATGEMIVLMTPTMVVALAWLAMVQIAAGGLAVRAAAKRGTA